MPTTSKRTTRERALQKLQTLLNRGKRLGVAGQNSFVWRGNTALWRNAYDLGASKHGGLLVDLDTKHRIVGVRCDDTGPLWDVLDEEHSEWSNINTWASDIVHRRYEDCNNPLRAEVFFAHMPQWNSRTQANCLLKDMALEQWRTTPGMGPLLEQMFDASMDDRLWRQRAQHLSSTLLMGIDKNTPDDVFLHRGVELNSKHLLPWAMAAGIAHAEQQGNEANSVYQHANVHATRNERTQETAYDWYIQGDFSLPHVRLGDIFMARLTLPHTMEQPPSVFQSIQPTTQYSTLAPQVRQEAVKRLYDVATGLDRAMAHDDGYEHVCQRILQSAQGMATYDARRVRSGVRVMADEWLARFSKGRDLIQSLCDLMSWREVVAENPTQGLELLVHAVRMAQQQKHQPTITAEVSLFSGQDLLL